MKICYLADATSNHIRREIKHFAKNHEIHLITLAHTKMGTFVPEEVYGEMNVRLYKVSMKAPLLLLAPFEVRRLLKKIKPDIVDGHFVTVYGFLAACAGFHPLVVTAWGSDILIQPKRNPLWKLIAKYALKKADLIVCLFPITKEGISELGVDPSKVRINLIGVDTEEFHPLPRHQKLRQNFGIGAWQPIVISTRDLNPVYNVETLIKSIPLILNAIPETKFIIAGKGNRQGYLENLAQELSISSSVRFIGWVSHNRLPEYLASADVYVSTSLSDGASNSLFEAMACGLAPVVTNIPANRLWIEDGENGFLFPIKDYETLASKIIYLINNKDKRERLGKRSREIVQRRAEQQTKMGKLERVYQELIENKY